MSRSISDLTSIRRQAEAACEGIPGVTAFVTPAAAAPRWYDGALDTWCDVSARVQAIVGRLPIVVMRRSRYEEQTRNAMDLGFDAGARGYLREE